MNNEPVHRILLPPPPRTLLYEHLTTVRGSAVVLAHFCVLEIPLAPRPSLRYLSIYDAPATPSCLERSPICIFRLQVIK